MTADLTLYARWGGILVTEIVLEPTTLELKPLEVGTIRIVKINPSNATDQTLTWTSEPNGISIDKHGDYITMSTGYKGIYTVTAEAVGGAKASVKVIIDDGTLIRYEITNGGQQTIPQNASCAEFTSNASFDKFVRVEVDGKTLTKNQFTARPGSTIITLVRKYISTLSTGLHTLSIISEDGRADTTFTVHAAPPPTGDSTPILPWLGLLVLGLGGILCVNIRRRKA